MSSRTVSSVVSCLPTITRSARASIRDAEFRFSQTSGGFGEHQRTWTRMTDAMRTESYCGTLAEASYDSLLSEKRVAF